MRKDDLPTVRVAGEHQVNMREKWGEIPVIPVNELLVRGNLPAATRNVQSALGA